MDLVGRFHFCPTNLIFCHPGGESRETCRVWLPCSDTTQRQRQAAEQSSPEGDADRNTIRRFGHLVSPRLPSLFITVSSVLRVFISPWRLEAVRRSRTALLIPSSKGLRRWTR